jgi:putative PEP-CTERM system histidine kinase
MSPQIFSLISIFINVILCIAILFRQYRQGMTIPFFLAAVILPLFPLAAINCVSTGNSIRWMMVLLCVGTVLLVDISNKFMRKNIISVSVARMQVSSTWLMYGLGCIAVLLTFLAPLEHIIVEQDVLYINAGFFEYLYFVFLISFSVYGLYIIESTYRFAKDYQRKVGRLCFFSFLVLFGFNILFVGKILLYRTIDLSWILISLSIYGIIYPILLLGFFRYRLGIEHVSVDRNAVYTSIVFTLCGVIFIGVGIFAYAFRFLHIDIQYFEKSLIVVSFLALAIVTVSSGGMRRRITEFVNTRFYRSKYDYREQFFHLYKTYVTGASLDESLTSMVENMKYAVAAVDAFVFLKSAHNNSYVMHRNPEYSTAERMVISGNEFPDSVFSVDCAPLYLQSNKDGKREKLIQYLDIPVVKKLSPSVIFPIYNDGELLGLLMIKLSYGRVLDTEDISLINVFTHSIGTVFYRNILANEKIEHEQFQSFHQVVSFVIHDIKNQIATLSLLARNATEYIGDQEFQKSLVRSIKNSAENLTSLVTRLTEQRNAVKIKIDETTLVPIVEAALEQCNLNLLPEIEFQWELKEECKVTVDSEVMKSIVLNILKNAVEAMSSRGKLVLSAGMVTSFNSEKLERFGLSKGEIADRRAIVIVEDTGTGMSQEFIDNGLFKPFVSTKDKGMGIGLYQCKVSVERMGGKIYCHSKPGVGTAFCVMVG